MEVCLVMEALGPSWARHVRRPVILPKVAAGSDNSSVKPASPS
jgi:hypothetical protein